MHTSTSLDWDWRKMIVCKSNSVAYELKTKNHHIWKSLSISALVTNPCENTQNTGGFTSGKHIQRTSSFQHFERFTIMTFAHCQFALSKQTMPAISLQACIFRELDQFLKLRIIWYSMHVSFWDKARESQFLVYRHFFFLSWWGDFFIIHFSLFHQISFLTYKYMPNW